MKRFSRLCVLLLIVLLVGWAAANLAAAGILSQKSGKEYLVEINRISQALPAGENIEECSLSSYDYVMQLAYLPANASAGNINAFFNGSSVSPGMNYLVKPLFDGDSITGYVRYEYAAGSMSAYQYVFAIINALFAVVFLFVLWLLV